MTGLTQATTDHERFGLACDALARYVGQQGGREATSLVATLVALRDIPPPAGDTPRKLNKRIDDVHRRIDVAFCRIGAALEQVADQAELVNTPWWRLSRRRTLKTRIRTRAQEQYTDG